MTAANTKAIKTAQGITIAADMDYKDAYKRLRDIDVMVVAGGSPETVLDEDENEQPLPLIKAFGDMQKNNPHRERTLLSVGTGSLFLAKAGVLQGFTATGHPDYDIKLEKMCQEASAYAAANRTEVMQETYVVNNARFDLGDVDENPFVVDKRELEEIQSHKQRRRSSHARKGSTSFRESNLRRESNARRANLRLGGLRVITSNCGTAGLDAALYLVCAMADEESAQKVAATIGFQWKKGVIVDSLDV